MLATEGDIRVSEGDTVVQEVLAIVEAEEANVLLPSSATIATLLDTAMQSADIV